MKNKYNHFMISFVILLSACFLSGCQLAKEGNAIGQTKEKLYGIFVTIGLDMSKYNSLDNKDFTVNSKGELKIKEDKSKYSIDGTMTEDGEVTFKDIKGYYMGVKEITNNNGEKEYSNGADKGFSNVKLAVNAKDNTSEEHSYEATLTISRNTKDIIHINPVFQRSNGSVYTVLGQDVGYMNYGNSTGDIYSETLDNKTTTTINGTEKTEKDSFKVNISITDEAKQITIKEMNRKDKLIKSSEYHQTDSEKFVVDRKTSYIIVEELLRGIEKDYIKRSIYSMIDNESENNAISHVCNFPGENGVIGIKNIDFVYKLN